MDIIRRVESLPSSGTEVDDRIAALLGCIDDLRVPSDRAVLLAKAELALAQLRREPANLTLFDQIVGQVTQRLRPARLLRWQRLALSVSPHIVVALDSVLSLSFFALGTYGVLPLLGRPNTSTMQLVSEAGFAGALTSLMLRFHRIRGSSQLRFRDAFFEGLFRPFIGVFFAWLTYYSLDGGLLPIQPREGLEADHIYAAVAFAAGFSERLGADLAQSIGRKAAGPG